MSLDDGLFGIGIFAGAAGGVIVAALISASNRQDLNDVTIRDVNNDGLADVVLTYSSGSGDTTTDRYRLGNADGTTREATLRSVDNGKIIYLTERVENADEIILAINKEFGERDNLARADPQWYDNQITARTERFVTVIAGGELVRDGDTCYVVAESGAKYLVDCGLLTLVNSGRPSQATQPELPEKEE